MAKKSLIAKANGNRSLPCAPILAVSAVVGHVAICVNSICAASVFANWRCRGRFPALLSPVGKDNLRF